MTTAPAALGDPYLLPRPGPDSPVVLSQWISASNTSNNACYSEMVWPLGPLIDQPGASLTRLHWKNTPPSLLGQVKQVTWLLINGQLRPTYLKQRGVAARARGSATEIRSTCYEWSRLARWLHEAGVDNLRACTEHHWTRYTAQRFNSGMTRHSAEEVLGRLTDLWAYDQLCIQPVGVPQPPWEREGLDDYLPASSSAGSGENSTEPLDPTVIGPLLMWSMRLVEDLADDILAAWAEKQRMLALAAANTSTPSGLAALHDYLRPLIEAGAPLPTVNTKGRPGLSRIFIAATTGCSINQASAFRSRLDREDLELVPGPSPMQVPVHGQIDGRPWRDCMDFNEVGTLMPQLTTAAMIVCLYLTGMRPQEVQGLRSGCCPKPEDGGRHLIRSRHYKNVTDDDGHHISAGEEREVPWVAITPVVKAIRVLERIVPADEFLFSSAHHDYVRSRQNRGTLKNAALASRIEAFVEWVNQEAQRHGLADQTIPPDPNGRIGLKRFRRTLAWHIARRPGGLIALAIQYGHMRTVLDARTSSGYGSRSRGGIHSVLDVETALSAAQTAARLRDRLAAGEKISGPAARRALTAVTQIPSFEGRFVTEKFARQATDYLARDGLILFDNPDACLICVFKRDTALCEPSANATAPNQPDCRPGCGNAIRLDSHASDLITLADVTDQLAAHAPEPMARRLRLAADRHRATVQSHHATAESAEAFS